MGFITRYGSFWGMIPQTSGRVIWVAPSATYTVEGRSYSASDNNDGLSPERAVRTIDYAIGLTAANVGDVIVLLPGAHTQSSGTVTVDVDGITITGIPQSAGMPGLRGNGGSKRNAARLTNTATAGIIFTVTAADFELAWVDLSPAAAGGRGVSLSTAADRFYMHDCTIQMPAAVSVTTYGVFHNVDVTGGNEDLLVRNVTVVNGTGTTGANGGAVVAAGTAYNWTIEFCSFEHKGTGAWAAAILSSNASSAGLFVRDCDFLTSSNATSVITSCINSTAQTIDGSTQVLRCYAPGVELVTGTASPDIILAESYTCSAAGGALATAGG